MKSTVESVPSFRPASVWVWIRVLSASVTVPRSTWENPPMDTDLLVFNGINGASGRYLLPPMSPGDVVKLARGGSVDPYHRSDLDGRRRQATESHYGVKEGIDAKDLSQTGWGVIFAHGADPAIREALAELLSHRKAQATQRKEHYYREYVGVDAYRPGESKQDFLSRHGAGPGPADPDKVPYYLLIAGDPESIDRKSVV